MHPKESAQDLSFIHTYIGNPIYTFSSRIKTFGYISSMSAYIFLTAATIPLGAASLFAESYVSGSKVGEKQTESFESYQMRILKSQNQLQAEKIQSLRAELLEINQKLNELKPHLFKHGDPENEMKISELNFQLAEKEKAIEELTHSRGLIQAELDANQKKLKEMETVKEALTAMVEIQRKAKEENLAHFMKQLEDIHTSAENHKAELTKKIQEHELHSEQLMHQLADKEQTIHRLDSITTKLNNLLSSRDNEVQKLKGHILSIYDDHSRFAENVSQEFNKQKQYAEQYTLDWQWLADTFQGSNSLLLDEIQKLKAELSKEKYKYLQELDEGFHSSDNTKSSLLNHIQILQKNLEDEKTKSSTLAQLQNDHAAQKQQLESLNEANTRLQTEMYGHLHQLISSLSKEREQSKQIEENLLTLFTHHEVGQTESEILRKELQTTLNELNNQKKIEGSLIENVEDLLAEMSLKEQIKKLALISNSVWMASDEFEIKQIKQEQTDLYEILTGFIQELKISLDEEKALTANFSMILEDYISSSDEQAHQKLNLELNELQNSHLAIQSRLEEEKWQLEEALITLNQAIEDKTQHHIYLQNELRNLTFLYQNTLDSNLERQEEIERLTKQMEEKTQQIYDLEMRNQAIEANASLLLHDLEERSAALLSLEGEISSLGLHNLNLSNEKHHLQQEIDLTQSQLAKTEARLAELNELNEFTLLHNENHLNTQREIENKINILLSELEASKNQNKALNDDLSYLRANYNREQNNNLNLEKILAETSHQLIENDRVITEYKTALNNKEERIQTLLDAKANLKKSLSDIHDKKVFELQNELSLRGNLQEELRLALSNYHEEQKKNQQLEQKLQTLFDELAMQTKFNEQMDRLQNEYQTLQLYAKALEEKALDWEAEKTKSEDIIDQITYLKNEYEDLQHHTTNLTDQLNNLSEILKEKDKAQVLAERRAMAAMNKNLELTADLERLLHQMKFGDQKISN